MPLVTLDLEGVLIPEIWIAFADAAGIPQLRRTTRDEPDYDKLMRYRLDILAEHKIKLADIERVISTLEPLEGAREFIDWLKSKTRTIILSDKFAAENSDLPVARDYSQLKAFFSRFVGR